MSLTLYFHPLSQPSRSLLTFLHLNDIKYEKKVVDILKGEHKSPEYTSVNPLQMIPAIKDGNFTLNESEAIIKYLMNTRKTGELYYPKDPKTRAVVDRYFPFHHSSFRPKLSYYFVANYSALFKESKINIEEARNEAEEAIKGFEKVFLKDQKYLADDILTIADIFAVNELTQVYFASDIDFEKFPKVKEYIERCLQNPVLREVNKPVKELGEGLKQKLAAAANQSQ